MPLNVVRNESMHLYARAPRTSAARAAVDALLRVQHVEEQVVEQSRIDSGLTKNEFHAVRYLLQAGRDGRPMGPNHLAVMLGVSNASVTKIVDALVEQGWLVRTAHPSDRRAQVIEPTATAAARIDAAYERFHTVVVDAVDALSDDDNVVLARALESVSAALLVDTPDPADAEELDGE
jgi:DNA-binding MarR family transcriptional regulator